MTLQQLANMLLTDMKTGTNTQPTDTNKFTTKQNKGKTKQYNKINQKLKLLHTGMRQSRRFTFRNKLRIRKPKQRT